jgi:hypothetical protein
MLDVLSLRFTPKLMVFEVIPHTIKFARARTPTGITAQYKGIG